MFRDLSTAFAHFGRLALLTLVTSLLMSGIAAFGAVRLHHMHAVPIG